MTTESFSLFVDSKLTNHPISTHFIHFSYFSFNSPNSVACSTDSTGSLLSADDCEASNGEYYMVTHGNRDLTTAHMPSQPPISESEEMDYLIIEPGAADTSDTFLSHLTDAYKTNIPDNLAINSLLGYNRDNHRNIFNSSNKQEMVASSTGRSSYIQKMHQRSSSQGGSEKDTSFTGGDHSSASTDTLTLNRPSTVNHENCQHDNEHADSISSAKPLAVVHPTCSSIDHDHSLSILDSQSMDTSEYLMVDAGSRPTHLQLDSIEDDSIEDYLEVEGSHVGSSSTSAPVAVGNASSWNMMGNVGMSSSPGDSIGSGQLAYSSSGPFTSIQRSKFKLEKVRSFFSPGEQQDASDFIKPVRTYSIGSRPQLSKGNSTSSALSNSSLQMYFSFKPHHQLTGHKKSKDKSEFILKILFNQFFILICAFSLPFSHHSVQSMSSEQFVHISTMRLSSFQ